MENLYRICKGMDRNRRPGEEDVFEDITSATLASRYIVPLLGGIFFLLLILLNGPVADLIPSPGIRYLLGAILMVAFLFLIEGFRFRGAKRVHYPDTSDTRPYLPCFLRRT